MPSKYLIFSSLAGLLLMIGPLWGQQAGSVNGLLSDPTGGAVAGAKITLTSTATGISRSATTGHDGLYNFPEVNSGDYTVTGEAAGFKKLVANVRVEVNQVARVDMLLELGALTERVEVNAAPADAANG
jgi:Carboxypeptidase regulatory-like domain